MPNMIPDNIVIRADAIADAIGSRQNLWRQEFAEIADDRTSVTRSGNVPTYTFAGHAVTPAYLPPDAYAGVTTTVAPDVYDVASATEQAGRTFTMPRSMEMWIDGTRADRLSDYLFDTAFDEAFRSLSSLGRARVGREDKPREKAVPIPYDALMKAIAAE